MAAPRSPKSRLTHFSCALAFLRILVASALSFSCICAQLLAKTHCVRILAKTLKCARLRAKSTPPRSRHVRLEEAHPPALRHWSTVTLLQLGGAIAIAALWLP